jgi:hypothetical protein
MVLASFVINNLTTAEDGVARAIATIQHPFANRKVRVKLLQYNLYFPQQTFVPSMSRIKFTGLTNSDALVQVNALNSYLPSTSQTIQYYASGSSGFVLANSSVQVTNFRNSLGTFGSPEITGYLNGNTLRLEILATEVADDDADPSGLTAGLTCGFIQFDISVIE